jgi:general secretion pathway protein F/type IV pilus assembly protein PilC
VFYTQMADLIRAGVPLLRSLELLENKLSHAGLRHVVRDIRERVQGGTRLAEALRYHPKVFSDLAVSMVRAGEEGAFLEDVLKRIATFTDHQENLKSRIVGAMIYPVFLLLMGTAIVVAMLAFFVPKFAPIFDRMARSGELPWATTTLMSLSDFVRNYGLWGLLICVAAVFFLLRKLRSDEGRVQVDRLRLNVPGAGPIFRSLALARFCRILGTLLRNGVPILQSLNIARDATGSLVLSEAIGIAATSVSTGKSLASPLAASKQFPDEIVEMISVGEEANNLEQVLIDVAENLETLTNRRLEMFVRMLEPVLLTLMAGIVLFVVIALLLPIMKSSTIL